MRHTLTEQVLALAALFQATSLVNQLARSGTLPQPEFATLMRSLFVDTAENAEAIYGSRLELELGLRTVIAQLGGDASRRNADKTRYAINLLQLERLLTKRAPVLARIAAELQSMAQQLEHFEPTHPNVTARLADIYMNHISTLGPRIMVSGENSYLENPHTASKVRALLLAGIRAAVLWRQCGGSRWQLLFKRRAIIREAESLLA